MGIGKEEGKWEKENRSKVLGKIGKDMRIGWGFVMKLIDNKMRKWEEIFKEVSLIGSEEEIEGRDGKKELRKYEGGKKLKELRIIEGIIIEEEERKELDGGENIMGIEKDWGLGELNLKEIIVEILRVVEGKGNNVIKSVKGLMKKF